MKWLTGFYIFFFSTNALAISVMTGLSQIETSRTKLITLCCGIYGAWTTTMLALITTMAKREAAGKPLVPINGDGGTDQYTKSDLTTTPPQPQPQKGPY